MKWLEEDYKVLNTRHINTYTVDELCNENKVIVIRPQTGVEIRIEPSAEGTLLNFYLGNEVVTDGYNYLVKPKSWGIKGKGEEK